MQCAIAGEQVCGQVGRASPGNSEGRYVENLCCRTEVVLKLY